MLKPDSGYFTQVDFAFGACVTVWQASWKPLYSAIHFEITLGCEALSHVVQQVEADCDFAFG